MKRLSIPFFMIAIASMVISFTSCKSKPKDADIKALVETALKAEPMAAGMMVDVKDGIATLSGQCMDDMCKAKCEDIVKAIKGVKSTVNNCTVAPAPEPVKPVTISPDDALNKSLADASKDFSGVKVSAMNGIVSIAGNLSKKDWMKLKQAIDKMTPKGYDLKALKIN